MGKKQSNSKSSKGSAAAAPKCTCDHPFKCDCNNRPERPSRGHKWDIESQAWVGKGHRQKGAGTQAVASAAKTTNVGQTTIKQWEKMPSKILAEWCKKEKRPRPIFKFVPKKPCRVILPDAKKKERDLVFVPHKACPNEEQAKEESAILALLRVTPSLPHERFLPEPYRSTWLAAVAASKEDDKNKNKPNKNKDNDKAAMKDDASVVTVATADTGSSNGDRQTRTAGAATVNTNLKAARGYASMAERRQQEAAKRKRQNARITRQELDKLVNKDHTVFMSPKLRKEIESLLRADYNDEFMDVDAEAEAAMIETGDEMQSQVMGRLSEIGFSVSQSLKAYYSVTSTSSGSGTSIVENLTEECTQWLCIHLEEDQLPEGFDPRGRTLDIVVPGALGGQRTSDELKSFCVEFGVSKREATAIMSNSADGDPSMNAKKSLEVLCGALIASVGLSSDHTDVATGDFDTDSNKAMASEEKETLEAIFCGSPDECIYDKGSDGFVKVCIMLGESVDSSDKRQVLEVQFEEGKYPAIHPRYVLIRGGWRPGKGTAKHKKMITFLTSLPVGEPMLYELYTYATSVLMDDASYDPGAHSNSLLPFLPGGKPEQQKSEKEALKKNVEKSNDNSKSRRKKNGKDIGSTPKRPRLRSPFWTLPPDKVTPAKENPKVSATMDRARKNLPAAKAKDEFLSIMAAAEKAGRVCLVTGETGCGKTTQIPQFLLENAPSASKIVVTQPRRLAATGVAGRVANERGEESPGKGSVGYVVRGDNAMCSDTRLMFCTTGVLLRQLQSDGALDCITHIVIDEVHERQLDTDVLLAVLKRLLRTTPNLRVILMSATMDADRTAAYWGRNTPRMHIPGFTFPVTDFLLEDVLTVTGYIPPKTGKKKKRRPRRQFYVEDDIDNDENDEDQDEDEKDSTNAANISCIPVEELVKRVNEQNIDYDMLAVLVRYLLQQRTSTDDGSILVFLPGAVEISKAEQGIRRIAGSTFTMRLLPLHGGLQPKDQKFVFDKAPMGTTKIILSTNVAETSITIPDCTIVIDTCREKQSSFDPVNRMPLLLEKFASRDSLRQRRGRAGRVRSGTCYKLVSKKTFDGLRQHGEPEIHRCALDQTLLSLMFLGAERGNGEFFSTLLDPPAKDSIDAAISSLIQVGAIERQKDSVLKLTPLGCHLAGIPAPPRIGKLLIMGSLLGVRDSALAIAAGVSVGRSPFLRVNVFQQKKSGDAEENPQDVRDREVIKEREELLKKVGNSDHALLADIYSTWANPSGGGKKQLCDTLGLSFNGMRDIKKLYSQLDSSLSQAGFKDGLNANINVGSMRIVRACVVSAFAPSQLVKIRRPNLKFNKTVGGGVEKDTEAKELKFYVRGQDGNEERVFIHPTSANFNMGVYSCPWLVYNELVRTSKAFLRDVTECSSYALLLFGGKIQVQAAKEVIVIDDWAKLAAAPRIGALIGGLRKKVDEILVKKISDPRLEVEYTPEMKLIVRLLASEGLA